jgi:hypothetical protein
MAFDTLLWVRKQKTGNCASRSVLRVLADHAGQDHSCYLRTRLIAAETDLSEGGVRKALARLIDAGLVRVYDRYDRSGKRISNRYQVLVDGALTPAPEHEDYADVRGVTLSEDEEPLNKGEGPTLNEGEGLPHKEASSSEAPVVKGGASRSTMTATRIPDNFMPDERMRAWFADEKLAAVIDGRVEHDKFVDYWAGVPGVKGRKVDWPATWRNWMRTAAERATRRPGNSVVPTTILTNRHYASTTDGKVMQTIALADKFRQMEENQ